MSQPTTSAAFPAAELERRFYAFALDRLLGWGLAAGLGVLLWFVTDSLPVALGSAAGLLVFIWLALAVVTGAVGTSPGKAVFGLRVVREDTGTPIGVGPALLRSLVLALSGVPTFGFGLAALAWTAVSAAGGQRRGWHDQIAHSVVVDVRPVAEQAVESADNAPRHVVNLTAMRLVPAPAASAAIPRRVDSEHSMRRQPLAKDLSNPRTAVAGARSPAPSQPAPSRPAPSQSVPMPAAPAKTSWAPPAVSMPPAPVQAPPSRRAQPPAAPQWTPPPATPQAPAPGARAQEPLGVVRWRATFDDGQTFLIEGLCLVGRRPEARPGEQVRHLVPLASPEMSVSKTHAHFGPAADGAIVVTDRGSTNGTVLVRQGATRQLTAGRAATLREGDRVMFGDRAMTLTREP